MPTIMLSVNNVMLQYIEAVDQPGRTGNLLDILGLMAKERFRKGYKAEKGPDLSVPLPVNHPSSVLMVPPEQRRAIAPLIRSLNAAVQTSE